MSAPRRVTFTAVGTVLEQQAAQLTSAGWLSDAGVVRNLASVMPTINQADAYGHPPLSSVTAAANHDWCNHWVYDTTRYRIAGICGSIGASGQAGGADGASKSWRVVCDGQTWTKTQYPHGATSPTGHGYCGNSIDIVGRRLFRTAFTAGTFSSTDVKILDADTFAVLATYPGFWGGNSCSAAYLAGRNWLVGTDGTNIKRLDLAAPGGGWSNIASVSNLGVYDQKCVAHPVSGKVLIAGGEGGQRGVYEVQTNGSVTSLGLAPSGLSFGLGSDTGGQSLTCGDPNSSAWVHFNPDYTIWNLSGSTWTNTGRVVPTASPFNPPFSGQLNNRTITPLTGLGCILMAFGGYQGGGVNALALYRHS
jgi:hypothetical protein